MELKEKVKEAPSVREARALGWIQVVKNGEGIAAKFAMNGDTLAEVYHSGYVRYESGGHRTIFSLYAESGFIENREEGDAAYRGETCLGRGWGICQWTNTGGDTHGRRYKAIQYVKNKGYNPAKKSEGMYLMETRH